MSRYQRDDSLVEVIYRDVLRDAGFTEADILYIERSGLLEDAAMAQGKRGAS